ncbi:unnamed protein product, partial [Rotaria sp. Silwood2]
MTLGQSLVQVVQPLFRVTEKRICKRVQIGR